MTQLLRSLVLFAAIVGLTTAGGLSFTTAQDKKDVKDVKKVDDKKDTKVAPKDEVGTVELYKAKDGFRFRVKNAEGKTVAMPPVAFDTKEEALKSLDFIKNTLNKAKVVEIKDEPKKDDKK